MPDKQKTVTSSVGRILPQSIDAEQALLGSLLIDKEVALTAFSEVKEDDFYSDAHAAIFEAMKELYINNVPIDLITVSDIILKKNWADKTGGLNYITSLTNIVPSAANHKAYIDIIKNKSMMRRLISAGQNIINIGFESENDRDALTFAEKTIFDISKENDTSSLVDMAPSLTDVIEKFTTIYNNPEALKGLPTGFSKLDAITNGLQKSDLILIAARPGVGKSSLAMNIAVNAALDSDAKVAVFSLEMPKIQIAQRCLCGLANVSMSKAMKGELEKDDWTALVAAKKKLSKASIFVDDNSLNTPIEILSKCRRLQREHGLDLIVIDYLQLMSSGGRDNENRQQEVSTISRNLKIIARELNVPVIVLSQLSRAVEGRKGDHTPQLSDLRESGAIEQDADIVMFIYKKDMYNDVEYNESEKDVCDLIIAKHRNGDRDTIKLKWIGEIVSFRSMGYDNEKASIEKNAPKATKKVDDYLSDKDAPPELESFDFNNVDDIF